MISVFLDVSFQFTSDERVQCRRVDRRLSLVLYVTQGDGPSSSAPFTGEDRSGKERTEERRGKKERGSMGTCFGRCLSHRRTESRPLNNPGRRHYGPYFIPKKTEAQRGEVAHRKSARPLCDSRSLLSGIRPQGFSTPRPSRHATSRDCPEGLACASQSDTKKGEIWTTPPPEPSYW